jgi:hypothetical protein
MYSVYSMVSNLLSICAHLRHLRIELPSRSPPSRASVASFSGPSQAELDIGTHCFPDTWNPMIPREFGFVSSASFLGGGSRIPVAAAISWTSVSVAELPTSKSAEWTIMRIPHVPPSATLNREIKLRGLTIVEDPAVAPDERSRDPW